MPGLISVQIYAFVRGVQPQKRQLVMVVPVQKYDMEKGVLLEVARGVQWWYPGNLLQCKVVNHMQTPRVLRKGVVMA